MKTKISLFKKISLLALMLIASFANINLYGIPIYKDQSQLIEKRVEDILNNLKTQTEKLVNENWENIEKLAKELLKKEVLHEEELNKIVLPMKKRI